MNSRGARAVLDSPGLPALELLQLPHDVDAKVTAMAEKRFSATPASHREAFF